MVCSRFAGRLSLLFLSFVAVLLIFPAMAFAQTATPTIQSDKDDYAPGELVTLTGSGWQAGESVHIYVEDDQGKTWNRNVDVTADESGNISDSFNLPDWFVATYKVTATGVDSGTATTSFTDANVAVTSPSPARFPASGQEQIAAGGSQTFSATVNRTGAASDPNPIITGVTTQPGSPGCPGTSVQTIPVSWVSVVGQPITVSGSTNVSLKVDVPTGQAAGDYQGRFRFAVSNGGATTNLDFCVSVPADTTAPTVSSINRADASPTNANSVSWTVTFSESVNNVDAGDFALANTGLTNPGPISVSGTGATRTVTASTGSGDGTLGLNLVDDDTIKDAATNVLAGTSGADGGFTGQAYTIDKTAPNVSSINRAASAANPTNANSVSWTVTFSESVDGVNTGDFQLANPGGGLSGTSVTGVTPASGPSATYTVTANTGSGDGTLRLDLVDDDTIVDGATNKLGGTGTTTTGNGSFTTGQTYTIDKTAPTVSSINRSASSEFTNANSVSWTVTFSESVDGVDAGDFALANTGLTNPGPISVSGSGATRTVTASTGTGNGTLGLNLVDDDTIKDAATNALVGTSGANGSFTGQVYTIDKTAPTVSPTAVKGVAANNFVGATNYAENEWTNQDVRVTFTCNPDTGGSGLTVTSGNQTRVLDTESATTSGTTATFAPGTCADRAGNAATSDLDFTANIDKTAPTNVSGAPQGAPNAFGYYTEPVDIVFDGEDALSGIASCTTVTYGDDADADEPDGTNIKVNGTCTDEAGNVSSPPVASEAFNYDATPPDPPSAIDLLSDTGANTTDDLTSDTTPEFKVTAEPGSKVELFYETTSGLVSVGTGTANATTGVVNITVPNGQALTDGTYTFVAKATDAAGNVSLVSNDASLTVKVERTIQVDATAPTLHLPANITGVEATGPNGAAVTFAAPTADDANPAHPNVNCSKNSGDVFPLGTTTVNCSATDAAGNTANGSFTVTVVDTTAPDTQITGGPDGWHNSTSATFSWTGSDLVTATGDLKYAYKLDNGVWSAFGTATSVTLTSLTEGSHTIYVKSKDLAGNEETDANAASRSFTVDVTAPDTTITGGPTGWINTITGQSFSWSATDNLANANDLKYAYKLDNGSWSAFGTATSVNLADLGTLTQGEHTFYVKAMDPATNEETDANAASRSFSFDNVNPTITLTSPANGTNYTVGQPNVTATYTCSDSGAPLTGSGVASCAGKQGTTPVANGGAIDTGLNAPKSFTVTATDVAGNPATVTHNFGISYLFVGWFQPVDGDGTAAGTVNQGKVGRTYPIKWQLKEWVNGVLQPISDTTAQNLITSAPMSSSLKSVQCGTWGTLGADVLEDYTTGATALRYDAPSDQFIYNYKAPSNPQCQAFVINKADGVNNKQANFQFVK